MASNTSKLPDELLRLIVAMSGNTASARLVCKRWHDASTPAQVEASMADVAARGTWHMAVAGAALFQRLVARSAPLRHQLLLHFTSSASVSFVRKMLSERLGLRLKKPSPTDRNGLVVWDQTNFYFGTSRLLVYQCTKNSKFACIAHKTMKTKRWLQPLLCEVGNMQGAITRLPPPLSSASQS